MAGKRRRFTPEFKARVALEALREDDSVQAIARRHELDPNQVSTWKRQLLQGLPEVFAGGAGRKLRQGARGEGPGAARQDRGAHGRAGLFSARAQALSGAERGRMIERDGPLSLSKAVRAAGREPVVAVLPAEEGERGEPGAHAAHGRAAQGVSVLREPAVDAASAPARGRPRAGTGSGGSCA